MKRGFNTLANEKELKITKDALMKTGITVYIANSKEEAKKIAFSLIPKGSEVMDMTSETLRSMGIPQEIFNSTELISIRKKFNDIKGDSFVKQRLYLGSVPDIAIGSIHAVTYDGKILVASNTGSQLPAYAYGARKVIWVVGTQKIVKDLESGFRRIYEYVLPLENNRMQKAYGKNSNVSKILIINKEIVPDRLVLIFVKEKLGF